LPLISLLKSANLKAVEAKRQLVAMQSQNIDITTFEDDINNFKEGFARNYELASRKFKTAIDEIVSWEKLVEVLSARGKTVFILFKYPSREDTRNSEIKMRQKIQAAIQDHMLTEKQMLDVIVSRKNWTDQDDELVEDDKYRVVKWREKLKNPDLTDLARKTVNEAVKGFEEKIFEIEYKKEVMMVNTAERKGRQERYEYLTWACSYDPETDERVWPNYLTYYRLMDTTLKNNLLNEFIRYLSGRRTEEIRHIARSNLWRISYVVAQKTNTPLFPKAVINLTPDQTNLAWWSGYYQSIYEMMPDDQPDDYTIENDEALDLYMEELHKERSRERQDSRKDKKNPFGSKSARHMKEQLIMRTHPDYLDLEYDTIPVDKKQSFKSYILKMIVGHYTKIIDLNENGK
jgi:hypothetical protein